jgi:hypothetical protein
MYKSTSNYCFYISFSSLHISYPILSFNINISPYTFISHH